MRQPVGSARTRIGGLAVGCVMLGACNGAGDPAGVSLEQSVPGAAAGMQALAPRGSVRQGPAAPVAFLPEEAGAVASVRTRSYVDGIRQDILLEGGAARGVENGMTVLARTSSSTTLDEPTPLLKPTEPAIRSEIGRIFPHMSMQVVERPSRNAYGPYGLALGRAGGTIHCLYAWQWIDQNALGRDVGLVGPVAIRIRLCKAGTTFDALADLVNRLSIRSAGGAEPLAAAIVEPPNATSAKPARRPKPNGRVHRTPRPTDARRQVAEMPSPAAPPVVTPPLAADLPPQAYLGPSSRPSATRAN